MVEIKNSDISRSATPDAIIDDDEEGIYRLLYSKSKVYVQPTAYANDNIPGFVALVRRVSSHYHCIPTSSTESRTRKQ